MAQGRLVFESDSDGLAAREVAALASAIGTLAR
jgi:chromosome partitioning protein